MPTFVTVAEVKTALRITDTSQDTELSQIIDRVEARLQGAMNRQLALASYTESYCGTGTRELLLHSYPLRDLTAVTIEDGEVIDVDDTDQIRYAEGVHAPGVLILQASVWPRGDFNVSVEYDAGYDPAAITTEAGDIWEGILDISAHLWQDMLNRRRGVQSQSSMDGSITYFDPLLSMSEAFRRIRWDPLVKKYKQIRSIATRPYEDHPIVKF
jgi:hypothetical protein